jgi:hypothetical protein
MNWSRFISPTLAANIAGFSPGQLEQERIGEQPKYAPAGDKGRL